MSAQQVARLEALLGRVQARAGEPRAVATLEDDLSASGLAIVDPGSAEFETSDLGVPDLDAPDLDESISAYEAAAGEVDLDEPLDLDAAPHSSGLTPLDDLDDGDLGGAHSVDDLEEVDLVDEFGGEELDLDPHEGEEAPPESRRSLVAGAMDAAMSDAEHQAPLTPPPESGEEPSPRLNIPRHGGPTMEQLGETIHLDEGPAQDFELAAPVLEVPNLDAPAEDFEAELAASPAGSADADLVLPADAVQELDRVRLGETAQPQVIARPNISTNVVEFVDALGSNEPESFLALLDSSLSL